MYRRIIESIGRATGSQKPSDSSSVDAEDAPQFSPDAARHVFSIQGWTGTATGFEQSGGPEAPRPSPDAHFVFLVHGWMGMDTELLYLEQALNEAVSNSVPRNEVGGATGLDVVVHRTTCNNGKTSDGIEAGGKRLAVEVEDFVVGNVNERRQKGTWPANKHFHATISFFGYSLGGMYGRFAISVLRLELEVPGSSFKVMVHPNTFCSAATPHLGVASHTYFILPRFLEHVLGKAMGKTGRDLFRTNRRIRRLCCCSCSRRQKTMEEKGKKRTGAYDLIYAMATKDEFLAPLSAFQRRVAYINAFDTDFQVPTATAGMLSRYSKSPHYLCEDSSGKWDIEHIDALIFQTEQSKEVVGLQSAGTISRKDDEVLTMSLSLDSLGWTKIFVDCREGMPIPGLPLPRVYRRPRKEKFISLTEKKRQPMPQSDEISSIAPFESRELYKIMRKSEKIHLFPTGHFVLVAHSKTERGSKTSAKGRPIMDVAASDLVLDMKNFAL